MSDEARIRAFGRRLGQAGRAHHEAFGGPNPNWPEWYAANLHPDIADHVGYQPTVDQIVEWLTEADRRHRAEAAAEPWPPFYAALILGWVESEQDR